MDSCWFLSFFYHPINVCYRRISRLIEKNRNQGRNRSRKSTKAYAHARKFSPPKQARTPHTSRRQHCTPTHATNGNLPTRPLHMHQTTTPRTHRQRKPSVRLQQTGETGRQPGGKPEPPPAHPTNAEAPGQAPGTRKQGFWVRMVDKEYGTRGPMPHAGYKETH